MGHIRVSAWAAEEIRRRADGEGRTVVAVVDRLLGKPANRIEAIVDTIAHRGAIEALEACRVAVPLDDGPRAVTVPVQTVEHPLTRCPKCDCARSMHQAGSKGTRCERHPGCVWEAET